MTALTEKEAEVMKCLWDAGEEITSSEIARRANDRYQNDWKLTTVSTLLSRLVEKGYLRMKREGKLYTYDILVSEEEYLRQEMARMADFWAGGTSAKLIAALGHGQKITKQDAKELKALLDELEE